MVWQFLQGTVCYEWPNTKLKKSKATIAIELVLTPFLIEFRS